MDDGHDHETYILLLLSDSNLPTGSFVASSGLESFIKHGFTSQSDPVTAFVRDSLETYARSALPFVSDAHYAVSNFCRDTNGVMDRAINDLTDLDELYETMTLNHVTRRASKSQGVALLSLYSRGFSRPPSLRYPELLDQNTKEKELNNLVDRLKLMVRKEETHGHLPICWGVLTAALGLTLERAQYLHLFLHARSLLSAAVRLNTLGPYGSQQLLLHAVRPLVLAEATRCKDLRTGALTPPNRTDFDELVDGPANTWPLGEILAARHDLQHSRIFNS